MFGIKKKFMNIYKTEKKLLRPINMSGNLPGKGFSIFNSKKNLKVGVLNLMGNVFMKSVMMFLKLLLNLLQKKKNQKIMIF